MDHTIKVVSYNLHGFNQGKPGIEDLISTHKPDIILVQEHWLTPTNLDKFDCFLSYNAYGCSAMNDKLASGMLYGRPFGGLMCLIQDHLQSITSVLSCSDRYVIIKIGTYIVINIYLPCAGTAERDKLYDNIFTEIGCIIEQHKDCKVICGGDFNCNLDKSDNYSDAVNSFIQSYKMFRCDSLFPGAKGFTYISESLQHKNTLDYILCSDFVDVVSFKIVDLNLNFSDHLPIMSEFKCWTLTSQLTDRKSTSSCNQTNITQLRWDRADLGLYYERTRVELQPIWNYIDTITKNGYDIDDGIMTIERLHDAIINALTSTATAVVPSCRKNILKFWWNEELELLKKESIETNTVWTALGKPRQGPIFQNRNAARLRYRNKIRECQHNEDNFYSNELHTALMAKHGDPFGNAGVLNSKNVQKLTVLTVVLIQSR